MYNCTYTRNWSPCRTRFLVLHFLYVYNRKFQVYMYRHLQIKNRTNVMHWNRKKRTEKLNLIIMICTLRTQNGIIKYKSVCKYKCTNAQEAYQVHRVNHSPAKCDPAKRNTAKYDWITSCCEICAGVLCTELATRGSESCFSVGCVEYIKMIPIGSNIIG